jgi:hypothetical protein
VGAGEKVMRAKAPRCSPPMMLQMGLLGLICVAGRPLQGAHPAFVRIEAERRRCRVTTLQRAISIYASSALLALLASPAAPSRQGTLDLQHTAEGDPAALSNDAARRQGTDRAPPFKSVVELIVPTSRSSRRTKRSSTARLQPIEFEHRHEEFR